MRTIVEFKVFLPNKKDKAIFTVFPDACEHWWERDEILATVKHPKDAEKHVPELAGVTDVHTIRQTMKAKYFEYVVVEKWIEEIEGESVLVSPGTP